MLSMPAKEVPNFFPLSHMQPLLLFDATLSSLAYSISKDSVLKYHPVNSENTVPRDAESFCSEFLPNANVFTS